MAGEDRLELKEFNFKEIFSPSNVDNLESEMLHHDQVECNVIHRFGPGVYIREVHMPKDTIAIGHHQNFEHMNVFLKGKVIMGGEDGPVTMEAPMIFTGKPGRKIGYIVEDVVWLNIYSTNEQNIEKLEETFLTKSFSFLEHKESVLKLENTINNKDYSDLISEMGFTDDQVMEQVQNTSDMIDLPFGDYKFKIGDSNIHGKGMFATSLIKENEVIGPARINDMRTVLGRYVNHSKNPNAKMVSFDGKNIVVLALKDINGCYGGHDGEEITVNYRDSVKLNLELHGGIKCQE